MVRLNPVRHGVLSQTPVLPLVERQEDWDRLRRELQEYWEPNGFEEQRLVDELAVTYWRKGRSLRFETESIMVNLRDVPRDWWLGRALQGLPAPEELTAEAVAAMDRMLALRLMPGEETLGKLIRYETMLGRQAANIRQQLIALKALRDPEGGWRLSAQTGGLRPTRQQPRSYVTGRFMANEEEVVGGGKGTQ